MSVSSRSGVAASRNAARTGKCRLLLVSPVRNEADHIEQVVAAVTAQTRPPDLWLVVDDDSSDATLEKLHSLEPRVPFMRVLSTPPGHTSAVKDRLAAGAVERAYTWGLQNLDWHAFTYIGKLDGDAILPPDYLERLLDEFEADRSLGLAGGALMERSDGHWVPVPTPPDHPSGLARIYRRECLDVIGGISNRLGSDPIAVTYARMNGFRARTFPELPVRHLRPMGTSQGTLRGRARHGATHYIVHYGPVWAVLRSVKLAVRARPFGLSGAAFLLGYVRAALGSTSRVEDERFRAFAKDEQRRRLLERAGIRGADASRTTTHPEDGQRRARLLEALRTLEAYGDRNRWTGTDPYEGLNATRFVSPLKRSFRGRQLIVQAVKRSPVDLRPLLGIKPGVNSATVAWVVSSYARGAFLPPGEHDSKLRRSIELLESLRCKGFEEPCWAYHFDTQSRVFFYPKTAPNTIATAFAGQALLDAYERTGDRRLLERAVGVGEFFLRWITQTEADRGACFGYIVGDRNPIQNANTHVCAVLARLTRHIDEPRFAEAARRGIEYALACQRADGSWLYGERADLAWVDGYHHGYVLDALRVCDDAGLDDRLPACIERGLRYYQRELLLPDGTPRYFAHKTYPIDSQSCAQAIQTFSIASTRDPRYIEPARRVFDWTIAHMRRDDGLFMFQRRKHWSNPLPHMRWVVAALLLALTHLANAESHLEAGSE